MDVEFEDLVFTVAVRKWITADRKEVLHGVSGRFRRGQLSAILGPSGAGKSSLLNAVSGYRSQGVSGNMKVNGQPRDERKFRKMSCYITQDDHLQPMLTVHELMLIAAELKLPSEYTKKQKNAMVEDVLETLGLWDSRNTRTESLSGGQRRRLSIALELVNDPPVLFLDEPTSGLDVVSSYSVVRLLRKLAQQGRTIVCTIHQPSAALFSMFHNVYVLSSGLCVYQGATEQLVPFLSALGLKCPTTYNPADFVIEVTDRDNEENIAALASATNNGKLSIYQGTASNIDLSKAANSDCETSLKNRPMKNLKDDKEYVEELLLYKRYNDKSTGNFCSDLATPCWSQFWVLFNRMMTQIFRNKIGLHIQLWHHIGCSLAVGLMFWGINNNGDHFFNHMKFCVGTVLFHAYTQCMIPVLQFPSEVKLLKKEHFNGWYSLRAYFLALTLSKVPTIAFFSLLYLTIIYFMSGLPPEVTRFLLFCSIGLIVAFIAESMGLAIGSVFSVTNGSAVGPMLIAPFLGFAVYGFDFVRSIPWYTMPLLNLSFLRAGTIGLVLVMFGMDRKPLECTDMFCYFQNPKVTLHFLDLDNVPPYYEMISMSLMFIFFRSLAYFGLKWRLKT